MSQIRILIVEDEPIIAEDLRRQLAKLDFDVAEPVESGEEALDFLSDHEVDLVLMDIQLAGDLDGIDTAQQVRIRYDYPVIFLTSNTDESSFKRAKLAEPEAFLSKPFRGRDLEFAISLALDGGHVDGPDEDMVWYNDRIFVKSKDWLIKVKIEDLLWIEAEGCYCTIHTVEKAHTIVSTLKKFQESVTHKDLMRVHRSYVVNLDQVDQINESYLGIGDKAIPIGRSYKASVQKVFRKV
ncbi:MAG: response regulator [Saprospiraceae bacterium]|nr:response regulator [Saprospiraceae bacterium]